MLLKLFPSVLRNTRYNYILEKAPPLKEIINVKASCGEYYLLSDTEVSHYRKGYVHYKTITSHNVSYKAQAKDFFKDVPFPYF